ncbi:flagellar hook-basal body complex protein FliE [Clostridium scatologenes]|uniref:Flagellar hook-basal body complex protein FliE n=1 Tax=Clostridium scatologenes TaxID=1548 RepID=A0A0E3MA74_CLOSL|nr:flagellar hook-basal body complex protein FliE [Clostridium scatologenes]AKA70278.1 flagellar hook-basal body complex subunit FliE [Clostridium scatologenes]
MRINEFVPDSKIFQEIGIGNNDKNGNAETQSIGFGEFLKGKLDDVNAKQIKSEDTTESFIKGDETNIHKVMLDTEEAKMSLELAVQIRNKFVEAYQELNRTQL